MGLGSNWDKLAVMQRVDQKAISQRKGAQLGDYCNPKGQ